MFFIYRTAAEFHKSCVMARRAVVIQRYLLIALGSVISVFVYLRYYNDLRDHPRSESFEDFQDFNNSVSSSELIVPNIVHFIRFGPDKVTFIDAVCILAAWKNQKPSIIFIHTDQQDFQGGPYWDVVKSQVGENVVITYREKPTMVFGRPLNKFWLNFHGGDVARLQILMEYGGIFLDNDSYIVKSLDIFRRFEMTLGWQEGGNLSNQVIIAHRKARFLKLWLESYNDYKASEWFYNAGVKPTIDILMKQPHLIHRVKYRLAEWIGTPHMIYLEKNDEWRKHYAIHLLIRHHYMLKQNLSETATYPVVFNEKNILNYDANIKYMAMDVYPFNNTSK